MERLHQLAHGAGNVGCHGNCAFRSHATAKVHITVFLFTVKFGLRRNTIEIGRLFLFVERLVVTER